MKRQEVGRLGERLAQEHLVGRGYRVLTTNYRCPHGEADIIAIHGDDLVFAEVRTRSGRGYGTPEESITPRKMAHMRAVAEHYLQEHEDAPPSWRIDVVAVELDAGGAPKRIDIIENAVGGA